LVLAAIGAGALVTGAQAANLSNIRISNHHDHVRVVLDLDAPVSFVVGPDGSFDLKGLAAESAVLNAGAADAPLKRVVITPQADGARLSFETLNAVEPRAFKLVPDQDGGNRIVVDLFLKRPAGGAGAKPAAATVHAPATDNSAPASGEGLSAALAPDANLNPPTPHRTAEAAGREAPGQLAGGSAAGHEAPGQLAGGSAAGHEAPGQLAGGSAAGHEAPGQLAGGSAAVPGMPPETLLEMASLPAAPGGSNTTSIPQGDVSRPIAGASASDETLRAERALDRGDPQEACMRADSALKIEPSDLRALVVLGSCRLAAHDAQGAKAAFSTALVADPSFDRARVGLATAQDMAGDHVSARAELSKVLGHNLPAEDRTKLVEALRSLDQPAPGSPPAQPAPGDQGARAKAAVGPRSPAD
jgi:hypothetical protein